MTYNVKVWTGVYIGPGAESYDVFRQTGPILTYVDGAASRADGGDP
jgi:hypothetical protein